MEENLNPQNPVQQTSKQLPQQPVQPVENQVSKPAGKSKLPMILIIIFVLLIILGSGAYLINNSNLKT